MRNQPTYWLNMDSTGVTLHESGCAYVEKWARPPKWREFHTEEAARRSTGRSIQECKDCFRQVPRPGNGLDSPYHVVQEIAMRINSDIAKDPAQNWESVRDRIKADFADEFRVLYNRALIRSPDGSDLLAQAVGGIASKVRSETVRKMRDALMSAFENPPKIRALWSSTRQDIINKNKAAIGMLAQHDPSAPDGDALLNAALQELSGRVWLVDAPEVAPDAQFLTTRRPKPPQPDPPNGGDNGRKSRQPPNWLKWLQIVVALLAAVATLIGVTVWDILPIPIPCNLPIFSWLPRC